MLTEIIVNRKKQIDRNKELFPIKLLESSIYFDSPTVSLKKYVCRADKSGIIAEFKRKSPSIGIINQYANVEETTIGYMQSGASALSVLTEMDFFMGKDDDLIKVRNANYCPILRKDFVVDEYQIIESKSIGADAVLLIAACLEKKEAKKLYDLALSLNLEVLFEVHSIEELDKLPGDNLLLGVNNRNLKSMEVNLNTSFEFAKQNFGEILMVSESGLSNAKDVMDLRAVGFKGFLMGEKFMKYSKPAEELKKFVAELKITEHVS